VPARTGRRPLTPERIVSAALRLADRDGVEALSMRRLGAALRVEAMSLYKHVPDKAALLDRIVASVWAEFAPPPAGAPWDARLRHVARELRALALRHPHVFPLVATRAPGAEALAPLEAALAALSDAGLGDDAILRHFWSFIAWSTGALLAECAAATGAGSPVLEVPEDVDRVAHPQLARLRGALAGCDFAAEYERGLELVVAAVRARL
jgi:AcrR family transcriptional regulator